MEADNLADIVLDRHKPLQQQLHGYLVRKICAGVLPPGTRLPSSRRLAQELGVSRNTIINTVEQLKAEGFLESLRGSGVTVRHELPTTGIHPVSWDFQSELPEVSHVARSFPPLDPRDGDIRPFTVGLPDLKAFPEAIWLKLQRRHQDRRSLRGFEDVQGYGPLRRALVHYLKTSRSVNCDESQIVITQGAQQALALCALVLLNEGDSAMVENPGYRGARQAFRVRNAHLIPAPLGEDGIDVSALPERAPSRLLYTTPTHQYPLGGILPAVGRLQLLEWAARNRLWIIEDDYDSEFHFHGKPIAALQGMAETTPVLYVGSFSKTLFPSLRLGYLVVPKPLVPAMVSAKHALGGETSLVNQAVVADFLEEGHFVRHLRKMRQLYQRKWEHLESLVSSELKGLANPVARSAGMHLALRIDGCDDRVLSQQLALRGFGSTPLSSYYLQQSETHSGRSVSTAGEPARGLVLGFANTSTQERCQGIATLRQLLCKGASGWTGPD